MRVPLSYMEPYILVSLVKGVGYPTFYLRGGGATLLQDLPIVKTIPTTERLNNFTYM